MAYVNRKTEREALAILLDANYTSNLVQVVRDYQTLDDLTGEDKKNPVVVVTSAGTNPSTPGGTGIEFNLVVHVFVLYTDNNNWTEAISEDRLDDIEKETREIIITRDRTDSTKRLLPGQSAVRTLTLDEEYRHEAIPVTVIDRNGV